MANALLTRFSNVAQSFNELQSNRDSEDYSDRLLQFYNSLDVVEDRFFINAVAAEVKQHSQMVLNKAQTAFEQARKDWSKYRDTGGISGLMRLDKRVTKSFKKQSRRLFSSLSACCPCGSEPLFIG